MESYQFLLDMAIILLSTKLLGMATKRFAMPQVVGALLAGLILGPAVLGVLSETAFMDKVVYRGRKDCADLMQSDLVDQYEAVQGLDMATQSVLETHEQLVQGGRKRT